MLLVEDLARVLDLAFRTSKHWHYLLQLLVLVDTKVKSSDHLYGSNVPSRETGFLMANKWMRMQCTMGDMAFEYASMKWMKISVENTCIEGQETVRRGARASLWCRVQAPQTGR